MAHSLIAGDGFFAVVLAAWWQLRRSAHLLPHLRKGPSSFLVHPGHGFVPGIMAIITLQPLLTIQRLRRPTRQMAVQNGYGSGYVRGYVNGYVVRSAGVPDRTDAPAARAVLRSGPRVSGPEELGWATAPIPIPTGLPPLPPRASRSMPGSTSGPAPEPPTCPFPVVGPRASGHATPPIGAQAGPPHAENGTGDVEPPTRPQQPAVARRGAV
jgi:hypothetical protein